MSNITAAQQARINKVLDTLVNYSEGLMTRRQWLKLSIQNGWKPLESTKNRVQYNRIKFNRMNHAEQQEYEKKCNEIVPCFILKHESGAFYDLTKIEYNYALTLST